MTYQSSPTDKAVIDQRGCKTRKMAERHPASRRFKYGYMFLCFASKYLITHKIRVTGTASHFRMTLFNRAGSQGAGACFPDCRFTLLIDGFSGE
jgi:hypothetical protein